MVVNAEGYDFDEQKSKSWICYESSGEFIGIVLKEIQWIRYLHTFRHASKVQRCPRRRRGLSDCGNRQKNNHNPLQK